MLKSQPSDTDYESAVEFAPGIFWVGFYDAPSGLHCNPYLIVDEDEAVVIDGGSRPDFATVMLKILQAGITPQQIKALIYQHYDPDLCGSIPNFEDAIRQADLKIISASENMMFLRHYSMASPQESLSKLKFEFTFSSGRKLQFFKTPYSHSAGSFITFDPQTGVLFTSDLFGSYGVSWQLFLQLTAECIECKNLSQCSRKLPNCPVNDILNFHKKIMTSTTALRYSLEQIAKIPFTILAPQHGSVIDDQDIIQLNDDHWAFYTIDVAGHGVPAAMVAVTVYQYLQPQSENLIMRPDNSPHNQGIRHPPPIILRQDGTLIMLKKGGRPIGTIDLRLSTAEPIVYEEERVQIGVEDKLLFYTDGVYEYQNARGDFYGKVRLHEKLTALKDQPISDLIATAFESLLAFGNNTAPKDDISLLGIQLKNLGTCS